MPKFFLHKFGFLDLHASQFPQGISAPILILSPIENFLDLLSTIMPETSCPIMAGYFILSFPLLKILISEPQTVQLSTFIYIPTKGISSRFPISIFFKPFRKAAFGIIFD